MHTLVSVLCVPCLFVPCLWARGAAEERTPPPLDHVTAKEEALRGPISVGGGQHFVDSLIVSLVVSYRLSVRACLFVCLFVYLFV